LNKEQPYAKGSIYKDVTPEKKTFSPEFILYSVRQIEIYCVGYFTVS